MSLTRPAKVIFALLAVLLLSAPGALAQDRYSIATGGTGGVYYPYGGALAGVLSDAVPDTSWTAEETSASVDNMYLVDSGEAALAFSLSDTAYDAGQGNAPFEGPMNVISIATLYNNFTQIVVNADSGITSIEDLRGKRVSLGSPGSGTEVIALRVLEAAGINPDDDISREGLGVSESAGAMKDGQLDAFFWSGGLPTAAITDLAATPNLNIDLLSSADSLGYLQENYGEFYSTDVIPAGTYTGQDEDVEVIVVPNVLVASPDMDEEMAYNITKALYENKDGLVAAHPEAENLNLETAQCSTALDYHPGALRYFEEQGIEPGTCSSGEASPVASPVS